MSSRPRILFIGHQDPMGQVSGLLLRTLGVAQGLASAGDVHYVQRCGRGWTSWGGVEVRHPPIDPSLPFSEWTQIAKHGIPHRFKPLLRYPWALWALIAPRRARPLLAARSPRISARALHTGLPAHDAYDLIWFYRLETVLAFWPLFARSSVPCVADVDDLTSADRDDVGSVESDDRPGVASRMRDTIESRIDGLDRRAWAHWQDEVLRRADTVVLSNPAEARTVSARRVRIVPNGFTVPRRTGVGPVSPRPVFTFVGPMHYFPNADAARLLVHEVLPLLRDTLGDGFEIRLVGGAPPSIHELGRDPNVTVTGYVDDFGAELARTDVMVVPLRYGSGTRLKILEAFAHEIPVVSTTIGVSGIDAHDGEHLLVADGAADFARACDRLARDTVLRSTLANAAYELVASTYDWSVVGRRIAQIVDETIDSAS